MAEAQKAAAGQIGTLQAQLQQLDQLIGQAIDMEKDPNLTAADRDALNAFIRTAEDDAVHDTKAALAQLHSIRDGYSGNLHAALARLHTDGYDPPASVDDWLQGPLKQGEARDWARSPVPAQIRAYPGSERRT